MDLYHVLNSHRLVVEIFFIGFTKNNLRRRPASELRALLAELISIPVPVNEKKIFLK